MYHFFCKKAGINNVLDEWFKNVQVFGTNLQKEYLVLLFVLREHY